MPDMVLLHGGSPKGAERIAACWADHHKVAQIVFKPDWAWHAKAAPFKRNDQMLEALPAGLVAFPGSGKLNRLCRRGRFAPPESRVCRPVPLSSLRPELRRERTNP